MAFVSGTWMLGSSVMSRPARANMMAVRMYGPRAPKLPMTGADDEYPIMNDAYIVNTKSELARRSWRLVTRAGIDEASAGEKNCVAELIKKLSSKTIN